MAAAAVVREIVPPQLEAVIIVYHPDRPKGISSVMAVCGNAAHGSQQIAAVARAKIAALESANQPPNNPAFNPQS